MPFEHDDTGTAKLPDRLIAAAIAGLCGWFFGSLVAVALERLFQASWGLGWWITAAFVAYGFLAPNRSRTLWSEFWEGLLGILLRRR